MGPKASRARLRSDGFQTRRYGDANRNARGAAFAHPTICSRTRLTTRDMSRAPALDEALHPADKVDWEVGLRGVRHRAKGVRQKA